jgi:hypothetical protein
MASFILSDLKAVTFFEMVIANPYKKEVREGK